MRSTPARRAAKGRIFDARCGRGRLVKAILAKWLIWAKVSLPPVAFDERQAAPTRIAFRQVRDPKDFRFLYRDYLWKGADMVALGVASFGHFRGTHYQNEKDFTPYVERLRRKELPIYRALGMTEEEKLIRELILQMKLGQLDGEYFRQKFGVDIFTRFAQPLATLRDAGHLTIAGGRVAVNRQGLLRVDELLHEFFLPEHVHARYT